MACRHGGAAARVRRDCRVVACPGLFVLVVWIRLGGRGQSRHNGNAGGLLWLALFCDSRRRATVGRRAWFWPCDRFYGADSFARMVFSIRGRLVFISVLIFERFSSPAGLAASAWSDFSVFCRRSRRLGAMFVALSGFGACLLSQLSIQHAARPGKGERRS